MTNTIWALFLLSGLTWGFLQTTSTPKIFEAALIVGVTILLIFVFMSKKES